MRLYLKNIGKLSEANVELNGITVIAGENNTGKSTVGKVLYSVFNSYYKIENQIENEKLQSISRILDILYREIMTRITSRLDTRDIAKTILEHETDYIRNLEKLKEDIIVLIAPYDDNFVSKVNMNADTLNVTINRIINILSISRTEILEKIIENKLKSEFNGNINNVYLYNDAKISLNIRNDEINIDIKKDEVTNVSNEFSLDTEIIYIDDPFILDDYRRAIYSTPQDHRNRLKNIIFSDNINDNIVDEIITNKKLDSIFDKINPICNGSIVRGGMGYNYKTNHSEKPLNIRNLSTGLKSFVILKTLLQNGSIQDNGAIILDEPEVHLHPEWQILFAEIIVLLQKEFNLHILLTTHSPYFLEAIEVYSAKYKIDDKCKYYLSENKGEVAYINDVTDNTESIYQRLARPFQNLENERYSDD